VRQVFLAQGAALSDDEKPRAPVVINGVVQYTSVSAMQKADSCLMSWRLKYVERLPDKPPSRGQKRGTEGHKRIETYLKTGVNVLDPLELKGLPYMPEPNVRPDGTPHPLPVLVEEHFGQPTPLLTEGVPMVGYMDLVNPRVLLAEPGVLEITDWKFKGKRSIQEFGVSAEDLIDPEREAGIQMLGYSGGWVNAAKARFPGVERVRLRHVTFQTEGVQRAIPTVIERPLTELTQRWETVSRRITPRIKQAASAATPNDVEKNFSACEKYGGCPYKSTCLSPMARIASNLKQLHQGEKQMGMLGMLNGKTPAASTAIINQSPPAAPAAPAAAAPPKIVIDEPGKFNPLQAKDAVAGQQYRLGAVLVMCLQPGEQSTFLPVTGGAPLVIPGTTPILPPMQPPAATAAPTPAAQAVPQVLPPDAPASNPALAAKVDAPVAAPTPAAQAVPQAATAPAEAPKRRGRKPKEAAAPAAITNGSQTTTEEESDLDGVYLYFGCAPIGVATKTLTTFTEEVERQLKAAAQITVDDIRIASDQAFGFGKWKGYMAKAALEVAIDPGHYIVTSGDERVVTVAEALLPLLPPGHAVLGGSR
jgi:hypothetical protein